MFFLEICNNVLQKLVGQSPVEKLVQVEQSKEVQSSEKTVAKVAEKKQKGIKPRFHYEREKEHSLFVLLIFFALVSILTARFNQR